MKYIVYQTVCKTNKKIYIGVHSTENPDIFDGYLGCGVYIYRPSSYQNANTPFINKKKDTVYITGKKDKKIWSGQFYKNYY